MISLSIATLLHKYSQFQSDRKEREEYVFARRQEPPEDWKPKWMLARNPIIEVIAGCAGILEAFSYIGAVEIGYLIRTNSPLPRSLQFLKGRMKLGSALMISGTTCLAIQSILQTANEVNFRINFPFDE